jgi:flavin-dependent dehydrogenase
VSGTTAAPATDRAPDPTCGEGEDEIAAEVVVAGAGPAGVAAAVALARLRPELAARGRILCFDKARFPREKPCGGGLTGHAWAALDALGLAVRVPAVSCPIGRVVYGRRSRVVTLARPIDVIRREEFDADLAAQARALGVVIAEDEGVVSHRVDRARAVVEITTSRGRRLRARVLVAADGAGSRIRKELASGDPPSAARASRPVRPLQMFKTELPAPERFPSEMIYDFSPLEEGLRGYVWLFPVAGGRLNVGAMHTPTRRLGGAEIVRILERTLARYGVSLPTARGWPAWPYVTESRLAGPHVLCVGDAAGIDALTGEGIAVGLEHGLLAAGEIDRALETRDFSFVDYGRTLGAATVGRELALDGQLAHRLYASSGFRFWLSLVMFDRRMLELYAARVCGSTVLADRRGALVAMLARHALVAPLRLARLSAARLRRGDRGF